MVQPYGLSGMSMAMPRSGKRRDGKRTVGIFIRKDLSFPHTVQAPSPFSCIGPRSRVLLSGIFPRETSAVGRPRRRACGPPRAYGSKGCGRAMRSFLEVDKH